MNALSISLIAFYVVHFVLVLCSIHGRGSCSVCIQVLKDEIQRSAKPLGDVWSETEPDRITL